MAKAKSTIKPLDKELVYMIQYRVKPVNSDIDRILEVIGETGEAEVVSVELD